jgi:methanogenic corrinoid protein MtbC1
LTTVTADPAARRDEFVALLADADEHGATALALELVDSGVPAADVLLDLVVPAQLRVGELWQANAWSIAQEHAATHISDRVVAAVGARAGAPAHSRGRVVVACLDGEWHALPPRIVGEVLRLDGWRVTFLGASVPPERLVRYLHQHGPDAVALSCALPLRLPAARRAVQACQQSGVPVLAGGRGFGPDGRWARRLGVDAWAPDARAAAAVLADRWPPTAPPPDLDHLTDDEYTLLVKRRAELVPLALAALRAQFPPLAGYTDVQLERTVEDLGHIVDFLAAAVYVDDDELFTDFVGWLGAVLTARHVPAASVDIALAVYEGALYDFPRARRCLRAGRGELTASVRTR